MAVLPPSPTLQNAISYTSSSPDVKSQSWQATLTDVQNNTKSDAPMPPVQAQRAHAATAQAGHAKASPVTAADIKPPAPPTTPTDAKEPDTATISRKPDHKKTTSAPTPLAPVVVVPPPPPVSPSNTTKADSALQTESDIAATTPTNPATMTVGDDGKPPTPATPSSVTTKEAQPTAPQVQVQVQTLPATPSPATASASASPRQDVVSASPSNHAAPPVTPLPTSTSASTSHLLVNRILQSSQENTTSISKTSASGKASPSTVTPLGASFSIDSPTSTTPSSASPTISATSGADGATNNGAALAATVTALHQAGQTNTIMRLDPPGLGHLSVQVGLTPQGQINVLFVPSSADAAHVLQASLPHFNQAMAQSGLALGQSQVGGQFAQSGGQNGQPGQNARVPERPSASPAPVIEAPRATTISGLSAYA